MYFKILLVVLCLITLMITSSFGSTKFPTKSTTESQIEIITAKSNNLQPYHLSGYARSSILPRKKAGDLTKANIKRAPSTDRLDTAATQHTPAQLQTFGNGNAPGIFPALYGYHSFLLNSHGFLTPESHLQLVPAVNFPYLTGTRGLAPVLYFEPCSPECEFYAISHRGAFPFFHHATGNRPVHDLADYLNPPSFQPYATPGHNTPEHGSVRHAGGQLKFPADGSDVDHTKIPPHLLHNRINGQYVPTRF